MFPKTFYRSTVGVAAAAASAAVAAARSAAAVHSATAAAWWQQRRGCGGFTSTVRKCANAHAFKRHQCANVRVFVIGRRRRDDRANNIVVGSNSGACGDVPRGRQCAAAADNDVSDDNTADVYGDGDGDDIVC
jgi:hypothetical protein